jgi:hypothetical protein
MANTIRVKRTTTSNRPGSLANAEIAFIEGSQILVYGTGTGGAGGSATSIIDIGGVGAFLSLSSSQTQTAAGTYTFSGTVGLTGSATATTQASSDNSTKLATTAFVKNQGYLTAETYVGTVTSVSLSLPGIFTVSGSPVTSSGTLSATLASQSANAVLAGPTTGGSNTPSFRSLVSDDIPSLASTKISDLATTVQGYRLDQFAAPTSSVSLNSQKITNLATPTADTDAVTKAYADALKNGLDVKQSVRASTTGNITLSGTQTVDGVSLIAGDRVLVKNQTTGSQNGIYVVAAGAWSRSTDADVDSEVNAGMFAFVEEGTSNADTGWVMTTNSPTTLGTTALTFAQFSGAGSLSVDATLSKVGSTIGLLSGVVTAGTYTSVTVDTYGRVTAGSTPAVQAQITAVGILKGAGSGSVSAATVDVDYLSPDSVIDGGVF